MRSECGLHPQQRMHTLHMEGLIRVRTPEERRESSRVKSRPDIYREIGVPALMETEEQQQAEVCDEIRVYGPMLCISCRGHFSTPGQARRERRCRMDYLPHTRRVQESLLDFALQGGRGRTTTGAPLLVILRRRGDPPDFTRAIIGGCVDSVTPQPTRLDI